MLALDEPYDRAVVITPSDSAELPRMRAIHVGATGGQITGRLREDTADVVIPVAANTTYRMDWKLIKTASTATTLHALR